MRAGLRTLANYKFLPEVAPHLPTNGQMCTLQTRSEKKALPDHIEEFIERVVSAASIDTDINTTRTFTTVSKQRIGQYYASLRYFLRTLRDCSDDLDLDYIAPSLDKTNDVSALFDPAHISAVIRRSEEQDHLPQTPTARTVASYMGDLLAALSKANVDVDLAEIKIRTKTSVYCRAGREAEKGMTKKKQNWCEDLLSDSRKQRLFHNLHRVFQEHAQNIIDTAANDERELTKIELEEVRKLGTIAAAVAIQNKGRPIRLGNVLGARIHGPNANFAQPSRYSPTWTFHLVAEETKTQKDEPSTSISGSGNDVLDWYYKRIRPLFHHADKSIFLFPAVESAAHLNKGVFDRWFQRAAAKAGIPMTFHLWRAGVATLLLDDDWNNLPIAADMLANTPAVCARSYAFLNPGKTIAAGQNILATRAAKLGVK